MALWYYGLNGGQSGPVDEDEIRAMLVSGMINGNTLVWREGMEQWLPLARVPEWAGHHGVAGSGPTPGHAPSSSAPTGYPLRPVSPTNGAAIASLVCGIASLALMMTCLMGILAGIPAVICGHIALGQIDRAGMPNAGRGMAIAGLVTGYISILITVIGGLVLGIAIARDMP